MGKDKKPDQALVLADQAGALAEGKAEVPASPESEDFLFVSVKKPKKRSILTSSQMTPNPDVTLDHGSAKGKACFQDDALPSMNENENPLLTSNGRDLDCDNELRGSSFQDCKTGITALDGAGISYSNRPIAVQVDPEIMDAIEKNLILESSNVGSDELPNNGCHERESSQDRRRSRSGSNIDVTNSHEILPDCSNNNVHISSNADSMRKNVKKGKKKSSKRKQEEEEVELILKELDLIDEKRSKGKSKKVQTVTEVESPKGDVQNISEGMENAVPDASKVIKKSKKKRNNRRLEEEAELPLKELNAIVEANPDEKSYKVALECSSLEGQCLREGTENNSQKVHEMDENHTVTAGSSKKRAKKLEKQKVVEENCEFKLSLKKEETNSVCAEDVSVEGSDLKGSAPKKDKNSNEEKKDKKRPGKKQLAIIRDSLKKAKEEEEKLRKKEEAKLKALEEAERLKQEKLRLEEERKERKKQTKKAKLLKMRAEGKLLSKSQKQSRARMEATLKALRQQGVEVPMIGEKLPPRPRMDSFRSSNRRKRLDSQQSMDDSSTVSSTRHKSVSSSSQESSGDPPACLELKDSCELSSIEGSAVSQSDGHRLSCSEDSDVLDESSSTENSKSLEFKIPKLVSIKHKVNSVKSTKLRSPVVCVLGHVDTGKTKILDNIRKTHVGDNEAGHITQQIGATMIPQDALKEKCKMVRDFHSMDLNVPGLLVIDTPGHESFSNLRSRGSSICDIAVLVVDIMHGLEPQTIESINLLKERKTPFIVALNKIDRLYGWASGKDQDVEDVVKNQPTVTQQEFHKKCREIILQFATQSLNAVLYYENEDTRSYVSMVPTSAITGDGMGNILSVIVQLSQNKMSKKLIFSEELQATVLEVKVTPGMGTTIDVILVNGRLKEGDTIVAAGHDGPVVTQIRSLLMPQPLKELRVKNPYKEYKVLEGAQGIKVIGKDLDKVIAGLPLFVVDNNHKIEKLKEEMNSILQETIQSFNLSERGVYVQASTLGSLEALLEFLRTSSIPYSGVKVGPVVKKDVMKASVMLEHDSQYAAILAFDVKIEREAQEIADNVGVKIFHADIIYHLFDKFIDYREELRNKKKMEVNSMAVFPCKLKVLPHCVFSARDPIVIGVSVEAGTLKLGTPLCVPSQDNLAIGTVTNIELNHKQLDCANKGQDVVVKIEPKHGESPKAYGKHFTEADVVVSRISRQSIDICKEHFREAFQPSDWQLVIELKKLLHVL